MKIAICDDDKEFLAGFARQLRDIQYVKIVDSYSEFDTLKSELSGSEYDVVMMDLEWERADNGMDISAQLWKDNTASRIVYVTSNIEKFV